MRIIRWFESTHSTNKNNKYHKINLAKTAEKESKFKHGDYVKSILGIIRIEKIWYDSSYGYIRYSGLPYWWNADKEIVRTKYKNFKDMGEPYITHFCRLENENDKVILKKVE